MRVWVYPEKTYEELGAERYQAEWQEVPKQWDGLTEAQKEEWGPDNFQFVYAVYRGAGAKAKAVKRLKQAIASKRTAYGCGTVTRQVVDWYVEEDRVAEWTDVGDPEYVP